MSIYIAHSRNNASNALNVPNTDQKDTSSVYDENSQFAYPAHAIGVDCVYSKKLSCCRETTRCFMSLNVSLSLKITQGHSKWYYLKAWVRFPIRIP